MIQSLDPRTGVPFGPAYDEADRAAINRAVDSATDAFVVMRDRPPSSLSAGLESIAAMLDSRAGDLVTLADRETALGSVRLDGELLRTTNQLRMFAQLVRDGEHLGVEVSTMSDGPPRDLRRLLMPVGVVAVFAASNFPFAFSIAGGDTASALASGCPVVVKAHYGHPQTSQLTADLARVALRRSGLPADALQIVHGTVASGRHLVAHPDIAAVGFTGSTTGGRAIADLGAARPTPIQVYAEQGSLNPVVIAPSALVEDDSVERRARLIAGSVLAGGGQFCTKPGLLFVPRERAAMFGHALVTEMKAAPPIHLLTVKIRDEFERVTSAARVVEGARSWVGEVPAAGIGAAPILLTVGAARFRAEPSLRAEMFGPATVLIEVDDLADLHATLSALEGNLTGTVHGAANDPWVREAVQVLAPKVGRMIFGGVPTGVAVDRAMQHGGPYPASSSARDTSVGPHAIARFMRPIAYQDFPDALLPPPLRWRA